MHGHVTTDNKRPIGKVSFDERDHVQPLQLLDLVLADQPVHHQLAPQVNRVARNSHVGDAGCRHSGQPIHQRELRTLLPVQQGASATRDLGLYPHINPWVIPLLFGVELVCQEFTKTPGGPGAHAAQYAKCFSFSHVICCTSLCAEPSRPPG